MAILTDKQGRHFENNLKHCRIGVAVVNQNMSYTGKVVSIKGDDFVVDWISAGTFTYNKVTGSHAHFEMKKRPTIII